MTVALGARQIMKLGDVGAVVARRAFDVASHESGVARPDNPLGNAPWFGALCPRARFSFQAADAMNDIIIPRSFAELTVVDDVDADFDLASHRVADGRCQRGVDHCLIVSLAAALGCEGLANQRRQWQAAGMGGENTVGTALH